MGKKTHLAWEGHSILKKMYHSGFGTKKCADIHSKRGVSGKIYSTKTYDDYNSNWIKYCEWIAKNHPENMTIPAAAVYVQEYVNNLIAQGKSPWTIHTYAAAAIKVTGIDGTTISMPQRTRAVITKSRVSTLRDAQFAADKHTEEIAFCEATGLRRREAEALRGTDLIYRDGKSYVRVLNGKGGKERTSPIIGKPEAVDAVVNMIRTAGGAKVWPQGLPEKMDVHNCRAGYAATLYHQVARPLDQLTMQEKYFCRKDKAGTVYDRAALSAVSTALGHGHTDTRGIWHDNPREVAEHYAYRF